MIALHTPSLFDREVTLADGQTFPLADMNRERLQQLQWDQEQSFARAILAAPKGSPERSEVTAHAYDTICTILAAMNADAAAPLVMGLDPRYIRLVLSLLREQVRHGIAQPQLFEIGYGSGKLLAAVREHGFAVGGIEVSAAMRDQAASVLGERYATNLLLGHFCSVKPQDLQSRPTLIYWNDVLEHIAPDEATDFVDHIHRLLAPGGQLVTISPNWLLRPSDVTAAFCPPRTVARGLHLKEYRLGEVTRLLQHAGFRRVATPLIGIPASSRWARFVMAGSGCRLAKQWLEPAIEFLPARVARAVCRGLAMSCTVATK